MQRATRGHSANRDDFWISDLGLSEVEPAVACAAGPEGSAEIDSALVYFLRVANKGVAHLTVDSPPTDLQKF